MSPRPPLPPGAQQQHQQQPAEHAAAAAGPAGRRHVQPGVCFWVPSLGSVASRSKQHAYHASRHVTAAIDDHSPTCVLACCPAGATTVYMTQSIMPNHANTLGITFGGQVRCVPALAGLSASFKACTCCLPHLATSVPRPGPPNTPSTSPSRRLHLHVSPVTRRRRHDTAPHTLFTLTQPHANHAVPYLCVSCMCLLPLPLSGVVLDGAGRLHQCLPPAWHAPPDRQHGRRQLCRINARGGHPVHHLTGTGEVVVCLGAGVPGLCVLRSCCAAVGAAHTRCRDGCSLNPPGAGRLWRRGFVP